jgi:RNA polymerase sigma-70 factor, ECF subfamily
MLPVAQEKLYRLFYTDMVRLCMRYCHGDQEIAASIYNTAMLKVFKNIQQYSGKGEFPAWVRSIVINASIDHCRSRAKFRETGLEDEMSDVVTIVPEVYNRISGNEIIQLIHELPANTALVFNLFIIEGYKHAEIGQLLGISPGTSKWHVNEARRLLKQKLETLFKKEYLANAI